MKEPHVHDYKEAELVKLVNVQKNYKGTSGDKAFLMRVCKCGDKEAFEYGDTKKMQQLLQVIEDKE